jgi:CheY-like chemotaxis protein
MPRSSTVLLLVDDEKVRGTYGQMLRLCGFSTIVASSGADALELASRFPPDMVVLDSLLEDLDGFRTARALKGNPVTRRVPIIAFAAPGTAPWAVEAGCDLIFQKATTVSEFLERVLDAEASRVSTQSPNEGPRWP